jgi:tetratricopeptide (TPR) repeat protein/TolB-like protein
MPPRAESGNATTVGAAEMRALPRDTAARITPILERCLASDADARFQSARDVEDALKQLPVQRRRLPGLSYALALVALAAVIGALLLALGTNATRSLGGPGPPVIGVSRLFTSPDDASLSYLAAGLGEVIAGDLSASNAVVAARSDAGVTSPEEAATLARELGADALVLGKVERIDAQVAVTLRLFDVERQSFSETSTFSRAGTDLPGIRSALTAAVRSRLKTAGVTLPEPSPGSADSTERLLPANMQSFEEYAQARSFLERTDVQGSIDHAIKVLDGVIAREPGFALAHAAMGEATWRKWEQTRDSTWSDAALKYALEALRLSANQPEVRYVLAIIYQGTGRQEEALAELEQVARSRPNNDDVHRQIGLLYAGLGQQEAGLKSLQRAVDLRPGYWGNHAALGLAAYQGGQYSLAITAFQRYCELRPDSASAHQRLGTAYHAAGNLDAALRSYERALEISPNAKASSNVGTLHFDAGRYPEAVKAYSRAVELDPRNPSLHRNLADALRRAGNVKRAASEYAIVVTLADAALRVNPKDASTLSLKAVALARLGKLPDAHAISSGALKAAPTDYDVLYEHALILVLLDRKDDAVEMLRRAVDAGYSPLRLRADPDLVSLSDQPRFRELTSRKP